MAKILRGTERIQELAAERFRALQHAPLGPLVPDELTHYVTYYTNYTSHLRTSTST